MTRAAATDDPKKIGSHVSNILRMIKGGIGSRLPNADKKAAVKRAIQNTRNGKRTGIYPDL